MTSGWQPGPGGPGPYGAPGPGWSGYGAPYGSPYGWSQPPAEPEPAGPRPRPVVLGIGLWALGLVCSLIGSIWSLTHLDGQLADARARSGFGGSALDDSGFVHTITVAAGVFGLVWLAAYAAFLVVAWQGRNWARIVLWVLGGLGMFGFVGLVGATPGRATLLLVQLLLTLAGIVLLAVKPANDWYRRRGQELAAARRR